MTFLAAVIALSPLFCLQNNEESVLVSYDLRSVMPRWDSGSSWSQSLLVRPLASPRQDYVSLEGSLEYADLASVELVDLLTQILGDDLRREGREILAEGHNLSVLAPPALQEQVRSILESLETALAGTVPMRVDVLSLGAGGGELGNAGLLSEDEAAKLVTTLVGRGAQHKSYTLELSPGRTARLDAYRRIPFLFDFDVEVAQQMVVFSPQMSDTTDGLRLVLRGLAAPGGVALSSLLLRSELVGKLGEHALKVRGVVNETEGGKTQVLEGPQSIQVPQVLVRGLAFDSFLPDGRALALTLEASLGESTVRELVLLRRLGGTMTSYAARPIPRTNRTLIALDAELFRPARLTSEAAPWVDEQGVPQPNVVATFDGELSSFLLEWLKARFSVWRRFGPWILIVTDPSWDRDAAAQLDRLVKSLRPATGLRTLGIDLRAQGREPAFPVRARVPVLDGTSAGLVLARGFTAVTGFDAEIAQGAAVHDPFVSSVFEGVALALTIQGTTLEASGLAQLLDAPPPVVEAGYDVFGAILRPEPRVLRFDERVELPEGRPGPVRIGGGSERADQLGLTLEISVSNLAR